MTTRRINAEFLKANKDGWNIRTPVHFNSAFYCVESFKNGERLSLKMPELELLGSIKGKKILHLQCHFGLDTLSLSKLGAITTGVDISDVSIEKARKLSTETGIPSSFVCEDVQDLRNRNLGLFDIVFTSYGVIPWLENLNAWAEGIVNHLIPGGKFILVEYHPVVDLIYDGKISGWNTYFEQNQPDGKAVTGTYADPSSEITFTRYTWQHSISEVITAILGSELIIRDFQEYPYSSYPLFPELEMQKDGVWFPKHFGKRIPYMYSLVAERNP